ncbi:ATP dependent helicase [Pelomyxa schiedti]|nr:ATP dependent helicase [Pelomyxa schiedti]
MGTGDAGAGSSAQNEKEEGQGRGPGEKEKEKGAGERRLVEETRRMRLYSDDYDRDRDGGGGGGERGTRECKGACGCGWGGVVRIGVTNPRRVGAVSVARRVAQERGGQVGDEVGFSVRFSDCTSSDTRIKYMTDGCLLRECVRDPLLLHYSAIILDEAHERSVNTDVMFGLLKKSIASRPFNAPNPQHPPLRLLVTSATLDVVKFSSFFGGCPVLTVPGRTFPVACLHIEPKDSAMSTVNGTQCALNLVPTVDLITKIHVREPPGDILVFLTGQEEILMARKMLLDKIQRMAEDTPELLEGSR